MDQNDFQKLIQRAYKKLKAAVFYDKTQLILRDKIVEYESKDTFDPTFFALAEKIMCSELWDTYQKELLSSISYSSFPKKLKMGKGDVVNNWALEKVEVKEAQYFINMSVEGHIVGIMWLLLIGIYIDEDIYEHSYGNRLKKNLINEKTSFTTFSPYLFEPYFQQYESWRDTALNYAQKALSKKQDVLILTLDFKRFFYQVDMSMGHFEQFLELYKNEIDYIDLDTLKRINLFVYYVIEQYSRVLAIEYTEIGDKNILPIGFMPSNILSNWCLKRFDDAIIDGWNPTYYGRYVDDVIIVDKIEKNSSIYLKAKEGQLKNQDIISHYLLNCSAWNKGKSICDEKYALLEIDKDLTLKENELKQLEDPVIVYIVSNMYNVTDNSKIIVHNDKVKIFYFNSGHSDALLTCFKKNISKNKSEFRFMPDDESVFQDDDYSEIYSLQESDSINKLRGVEGVSIDKFNLSKFLGKYLRISGLVSDKIESRFEKDIEKIFNHNAIIENYTTWEKVIEILVSNDRYNAAVHFIKNIADAVKNMEFAAGNIDIMKTSLLRVLSSVLCKSFALNWGPNIRDCMCRIHAEIFRKFSEFAASDFTEEQFLKQRQDYCLTRMCDKYATPLLIEGFINDKKLELNDEIPVNLANFNDILTNSKLYDLNNIEYLYYPYLVTMYDITIYHTIFQLKNYIDSVDNRPFNTEEMVNNEKDIFVHLNYPKVNRVDTSINDLVSAKKMRSSSIFGLKVGNEFKESLNIAVANAQLFEKNFELALRDMPNRSYQRYKNISELINQAIASKADLLVMPESYIPFEWIPIIARTCSKNQMAVITGVEHFKVDSKRVCNLTAVILPYQDDNQRCSHINFHLKKHYAPHEKQEIRGYRFEPFEGTSYNIYNWNDCWFPVYCCYELTSILDRALFQSFADALIVVEWNSDTNYYSNIVESLSRDLHCYCVQVNSSNYGDSRITRPSKTEEKDILKIKGGNNSTILVGKIDIKSLREFQLKEYELQNKTAKFKPTPPDFNKDIINAKLKHELWNNKFFWNL